MTTKTIIALSALVDKLGIDLSDFKGEINEEMGLRLISQLVKTMHKAGPEIVTFLSVYYKISEAEAEDKDFIESIKEIVKDSGISGFFN